MARHEFQFFTAGVDRSGQVLLDEVRTHLDSVIPNAYDVAWVDVLEDPERAERLQVYATPMLVKTQPGPSRRVFGTLSDRNRFLIALGLLDE